MGNATPMGAVDLLRYTGALALVLGLLGIAFVAARKYGLAGIVAPQGARRLAITETLMLDGRHKLVLVRRDDVEHLIVLGPQGAVPLETAISKGTVA